MKVQFFLLTIIFIVTLGNSHAAKILGLFYSFSQSHQIMGREIMMELARRGHQITMMSGYPLKNPMPNYKDIYMQELAVDSEEMDEYIMEFLNDPDMLSWKGLYQTEFEAKEFAEKVFKNADFIKLVESGKKFDLIFLDLFINDMHFVLGHLFDAPIISCSSAGLNDLVARITRNPTPYAYVPHKWLPLGEEMNFKERFLNAFTHLSVQLYGLGTRGHEDIIKKYFPNSPPLKELQEKVALVFSNSHYSYESPRPSVPSIIHVGGCHVKDAKPLPKDLQKVLDNAKEGAIYFSFGSNIKSKHLKKETLKNILNAFAKTKYTVLMKWETDELKDKPKNVITRKWFPQNDILAHPNIKVFITHGGLMSTIESMYHGVPIIGIPIFADQHYNVPQAVISGYGLHIDFFNITEENLYSSIMEITTNSKYQENIKFRSYLLRNQPIKPMDNAIFWSEFVIKNKGAPFLKTAAHKLEWYQILLLDIVGFVVLIIALVILICFVILKCTLNLIKMNRGKSKIQSVKKTKKL